MPRDGSEPIRWVDLEPFHLSHVANAHDDGARVVVTGTRIGGPDALPVMHRWTIDVDAGEVVEEALDDESSEYPRVPDALVGVETRYEYVTSFVFEAEPDHHEVRKHDHATGRAPSTRCRRVTPAANPSSSLGTTRPPRTTATSSPSPTTERATPATCSCSMLQMSPATPSPRCTCPCASPAGSTAPGFPNADAQHRAYRPGMVSLEEVGSPGR